MKKSTSEKLAESAINLQEDLQKLSVDAIQDVAPKTDPEIQDRSLEEIARAEGAIYIKPKRRLSPPLGSLEACKNAQKLKREHKMAWEYVKGVYENLAIPGESITFSLCLYPGDPDYLWEIPCNVPVYVPRMIANHLETAQEYHSFGYIQRNDGSWRPDEFTHQFSATGTHYRGKFRPIGAFAA